MLRHRFWRIALILALTTGAATRGWADCELCGCKEVYIAMWATGTYADFGYQYFLQQAWRDIASSDTCDIGNRELSPTLYNDQREVIATPWCWSVGGVVAEGDFLMEIGEWEQGARYFCSPTG
jgi:hypothetical protein